MLRVLDFDCKAVQCTESYNSAESHGQICTLKDHLAGYVVENGGDWDW